MYISLCVYIPDFVNYKCLLSLKSEKLNHMWDLINIGIFLIRWMYGDEQKHIGECSLMVEWVRPVSQSLF